MWTRIALILALALPALAENLFVRPGGPGTSPTTWNGAWSSPANIAWGGSVNQAGSGDTVYIAGGTYLPFYINESGVTVKRASATISACTDAAGWNATNDAMVLINAAGANGLYGGVGFASGVHHSTLDGTTNYGIKIYDVGQNFQPQTQNNYHPGVVFAGSSGDHCTVTKIEIDGGWNSPNNASAFRGPMIPANQQALTMSHGLYHNLCDAAIISSVSGVVFEHNVYHTSFSSGELHGNGIYIDQCDPSYVRFNTFGPNLASGSATTYYKPSYTDGTGWPQNGWYYGNIVYGAETYPIQDYYGGLKVIDWGRDAEDQQMGSQFYFYNNTLIGPLYAIFSNSDSSAQGWTVKNNIFINCNPNEGGTRSYNLYGYGPLTSSGAGNPSYSGTKGDTYKNTSDNSYWFCYYDGNYWKKSNATGGEDSSNEQNTVAATNLFASFAGNNFTLINATDAGASFVEPPTGIDEDRVPNTRGADTVWDRGAYEFNGTPASPQIASNNFSGVSGVALTPYQIEATGTRPMTFGATNLPTGLVCNVDTGKINGTPTNPAGQTNTVGLFATNSVAPLFDVQTVQAYITAPAAVYGGSASVFDLGYVRTNTAALAKTLSISNAGAGTLTGYVVSITSPFTVTPTNYSVSGLTITNLSISYTPTAVETNPGSLVLESSGTQTITLFGGGYPISASTNFPLTAALLIAPMTSNALNRVSIPQENDEPNGIALFSWNAPNAGTVRLRVNIISTNTGMDSAFVNVNASPINPTNIWDDLNSTNHTGSPTNVFVEQRLGYAYGTQSTNYEWTVIPGENKFYFAGREPNFQMGSVDIFFTSTGGSDTTPPDTFTFSFPTNSGFTVTAATNYTGIGGIHGDSDGEVLAVYWTNATTSTSGTATLDGSNWTNYPVSLNVGNNTIYMRVQNTNSLGAVTNIIVNWPGTAAPISGTGLRVGTVIIGQQ